MKTNARGSGMKTFLAVIFSVMLTFTMMPVMPFMTGDVHAGSDPNNYIFDVSEGNVTIKTSAENSFNTVKYGSSQSYTGNISPSQPITLTSNGTATNHTVSIETTNNVTLILDGLNINVSSNEDACAFSKTGTGELTVSLAGDNYLKSGKNHAGLEKNDEQASSGSLIIQDDTTDGVGSLTATSGSYVNDVLSGDGLGAGIGGKYDSYGNGLSGENITILSGKITAKSGDGAGIGGGSGAAEGGTGKDIAISGGSVTASSQEGAGIGGGFGSGSNDGGAGGAMTISGGSVTATSVSGAGIGGGSGFSNGGAGGDVTISGGTVKATSSDGAGIGGGSNETQTANQNGGTLSSGADGKALIVTSSYNASINTTGEEFTSGFLFNGTQGTVYGAQTLSSDITLPSSYSATIKSNASLTVPNGVTLTNSGTLTNNGAINNNGTFTSSTALSYGSGSAFTSTGKVTLPAGTGSKVTFDPNGGTLNVKELGSLDKNFTPTSPTKNGSTFKGWQPDNGEICLAGNSITIADNATITLTAQWIIPTYTATLTPDGKDFGSQTVGYSRITSQIFTIENTGNQELTTVATSLSGTNKDDFIITPPTKTTLTSNSTTKFMVTPKDGLAAGNYTATVKVTADNMTAVTKTVTFKVTAASAPSANTYKVTLKGDGGTGSALTSYTEGTGAALPTDWTKEGYTFAGWYDNSDFTGNAVTSITKTDTGAKTFYAKWTKNGDGATSAPKTPVKVKAKAAGTHSIKITWSKANGASYYKIYRVTKKSGTSAKSNSYKYIGKTTGTSFTAKSLKAGTAYSFKVKAVNSAGNSKLSKIVTAKTKKSSGAVNGSVGFTLTNISGNNVKVHWSKVSGAAKYQVASNSSGKMKTKWTGTNSLCTYTSTNLTKGKTYKYKMRYCKVKSGKNVWSKWSAVKTIKVK